MAESFLPADIAPPDFYIAAMGRSGSTMICNWLTHPPEQLVFIEPSFLEVENPRLLRIQLANFGMPASDEEWAPRDESGAQRFARLMAPRLKGRRWAIKEVLCSQHRSVVERLTPGRIIISVRNIRDVALSFFEKHRQQDNLHRFSDDWVADYCRREAGGLIKLRDELTKRRIAYDVIRYEDFTQSAQSRASFSSFVGWQGDGDVVAHLKEFDREFEVNRHGSAVSASLRRENERLLASEQIGLAQAIEGQCTDYQLAFGYK